MQFGLYVQSRDLGTWDLRDLATSGFAAKVKVDAKVDALMQKSRRAGSKPRLNTFQKGYLVGKAEVYCEQVRTGAKLVGAFGFDRRYIGLVKRTVKTEGCKVVIDRTYSPDRATAYIYKYAFVKLLMKTFFKPSGEPVAGSAIWVSGKLFGYSDFEIARYLEEQGYVKKAL